MTFTSHCVTCLKSICFLQCCYIGCAIKCKIYVFFKFTVLLQYLNNMHFVLLYIKNLKNVS